MKKKTQSLNVELTKKITLEEYAFGLQVILQQSNRSGTAGVLIPKNAQKLKEDKKEVEAFYKKALRHRVVNCTSDGKVYLERNIDTILKVISKSRFCVVMQKGSWKNNENLISVYWMNGCYIATYQEQSNNQVTIFLDHSPENIYQALETYLVKKDGKSGFQKKKLNQYLKQEGLSKSDISPIVRIQCTFLDNWKNKIHTQENLLVDENKLEQYATDGSGLWQEKGEAIELKNRIIDIWKRLENDYTDDIQLDTEEDNKKDLDLGRLKENEKQIISESKWRYDSFLKDENFPHSYLGYIWWIIKNLFLSCKSLIKTPVPIILKKVLPTLIGCILFGVGSIFWNLYATCYLNDTYFFERKRMWGHFTPYLLGGSLRTPSNIKGFQLDWGNITTEYIVLPLSIFTLLLLRGIIARIHKKGILAIAKDIIGIIPLVIKCKRICQKPIFYFIQKGFFYSCIFGFLLFNPFAVPLLVPIFLLSFAQGDDSSLALMIMSWRTAGLVKKVESGKQKPVIYEEVLMDIFGLSIGFLLYSIFNIIMWNYFDYDFKLRLILSILLLLTTLIQFEKKPKKPATNKGKIKVENKKESESKQKRIQKIQSCIVIVVCFVLAVTVASLALKAGVAFADDGGWTESGGTIEGLMANLGFGLIMGISMFVGLATLGVGLGVAVGIAAVTFGASTAFAATTDYGHRTAEQIVFGRYSDSEPTLLGTALQIGIELIPVWGNIYGLGAGARDISYDIQNWEGTTEDYINLGIDTFGFVMNGIGLKNDLDKLASFDGDMSKFTNSSSTKKEFVDEPFDDSGNLKANSRYKTGEYDYYYETDEMGRISSFEADDLKMTERTERLTHNANSLGKQAGDDAGHLIADRFGGSADLDNIVSQSSGINRSDYKIIENKWAKAIDNGQSVSVKGTLVYEGTNVRPSGFQLEWTIDGEYFSDFLPNFK